MMRLKHIVINTEPIARKLLEHFDYCTDSLVFWRASSNFLFRFNDGNKNFFLRFVHQLDRSYHDVEAELEFILYLLSKRYPCVRPVKFKTGEYIQIVNSIHGNFIGCVFEEAVGKRLDPDSMTTEQAEKWGEMLGWLHILSSTYIANNPLQRRSFTEYIAFFEKVSVNFDDDLLKKTLKIIKENLQHSLSKSALGMIHYDFEFDNVFYNDINGEMTAIDFDDCMEHYYSMDVVRSLNCIKEEAPERLELKDSFIKGYKKRFRFEDLSDEDSSHLNTFADLYRYIRISIALEESDDLQEPHWIVPLRNRLKELLDESRKSLENYV